MPKQGTTRVKLKKPAQNAQQDQVLKLNTSTHKRLIQYLFLHWNDDHLRLKDIQINDRECLVSIRRKPFLRWDNHHHYPNAKDHPIASYLFIQSVDEVLAYQAGIRAKTA